MPHRLSEVLPLAVKCGHYDLVAYSISNILLRNSVWSDLLTGPTNMFRFYRLFDGFMLLSPRVAVKYVVSLPRPLG
jgi:hypothetical protein